MNTFKKVGAVAIAALMLPIGAFADASTTATSTRRFEDRKQEIQQKKDEFREKKEGIKGEIEARKEEIKAKVEERREAVAEKVKERLDKFMQNVIERFSAAQDRLEELANRIDSRLQKMEAEGVNVSSQKTKLAEAKAKIAALGTSIATLETKSKEVVSGDTRALYPELKTSVEGVKAEIKAAHASLVDIVESMKGMSGKKVAPKTASTTTATSTQN